MACLLKKVFLTVCLMALLPMNIHAQAQAEDVLATLRRANDYFMKKYADPTLPTFVKKERPSSLWTRAVYYEGLMALYEVDPQQRYADYVDRWANFHQWTPRDGIQTCDADNQCCSQTYLMRYQQVGGEEKLLPTQLNLEHQMRTKIGWWTWIDAIQMAMPVYAQMTTITGDDRYMEHAMKMYRWSRDTLAGGLFNDKEGLWWRDKDFVPPYREPDGKQCYWSRGNGWVYAALVRCLKAMDEDKRPGTRDRMRERDLLRRDFVRMSKALLRCQREDGLWNVSLTSNNYAGKELTGTALFLYGMSWGISTGLLPAKAYRPACDRAWQALQRDCIHANGFLGWVQGTGKEPKDGQPLSYTRIPDFEDFGTGCLLLGGAEYYKLLASTLPSPPQLKATSTTKAGARWWWMGSAVDKENLRWNMEEYARTGIGTLEITPIYGVQGNSGNNIEFLSDKYMEMLRFVMDEGKRLGIEIDMATGTGWPFGGPWVPLEESACRAVFVVKTFKGHEVVGLDLLPAEKDRKNCTLQKVMLTLSNSKTAIDVTNCTSDGVFSWKASNDERKTLSKDDERTVVALYVKRGIMRVKRAAPGGEGLVVDHFDRQAVANYLHHISDAFDRTHTPYPHTFFNDSYEVADGDWTSHLLEEFASRRGYQLEQHLPEFLAGDSKLVADYRETLGELLLENFTCQWTQWAHEHGALTRNQAHGSPANLIDCYSAVDIPEIEGFGLSDFGIKGLRRDPGKTRKNDSDLSMLKYASSAAHVTGKKLTSSETFTWLTEHFRTSLSQMKPDLDLMFCAGVNRMLFHGTTYSPQNDAWPGWKFYASVDMSPTNSIWRDAPSLMKYIERCQSMLQWGQPDNDFLVYLPMHDMWAKDSKHRFMQFSIHNMAQRAPEFIASVLKIDRLGYDCDYISERQLAEVALDARGQRLTTGAGTRYKALIIPSGTTITPQLESILKRLAPLVIFGEDAESLARFAKAEAMKTQLGLHMIRRQSSPTSMAAKAGHHYFMANLTADDVDAIVPLAVACTAATWLNPMTGETMPAQLTEKGVRIRLRSGESRFLLAHASSAVSPAPSIPTVSSSQPSTIELGKEQGWTLTFIDAEPRVDDAYTLSTLQTWETLSESTAVTMGTGIYTTSVTLTPQEAQQHWLIDLGDVRESARVYINNVYAGCAWAVPYVLDCRDYLHKGKNEIRIEVTNLPANRIADMDRRGINWRKFEEINMVDINYKKTNYADWEPVKSGLASTVRLITCNP